MAEKKYTFSACGLEYVFDWSCVSVKAYTPEDVLAKVFEFLKREMEEANLKLLAKKLEDEHCLWEGEGL